MDFWQKQDPSKPLFEGLLWSKPETKATSGKLLIIGGQKENFSKVAKAYEQAIKSGAGTVKTLLPDSLLKIANFLPDVEFAPSNKSGGFGATALDAMLSMSGWADMVLLPGDLGKSSETVILMDKFIQKYKGSLTLSSNCLESIHEDITKRPNTTFATDLAGLQKVSKQAHFERAFTSTMGALSFADTIHGFSETTQTNLICMFNGQVWVASRELVSATPQNTPSITNISASGAVWLMQNPLKPFEALTTSLVE